MASKTSLKLGGTSDVVVREWAARIGLWRRIALLLELERRCLTGQFSKALRDSVDVALTRECNAVTRMPGWPAQA